MVLGGFVRGVRPGGCLLLRQAAIGWRDSVSVTLVVILSSAISAVVGVFGLLVAERERKKGSAWWAWVLPGAFGVLLIVVGLVRLLWVI
jgi:hypothetical protein